MRSRSAWLAACSGVLLLAACGGGAPQPRLPAALAGELDADARRVAAAQEACVPAEAARRALVAAVVAAVNARRVPPELQEELLGRVNAVPAACAAPRRAAREARELVAWLRDHGA